MALYFDSPAIPLSWQPVKLNTEKKGDFLFFEFFQWALLLLKSHVSLGA